MSDARDSQTDAMYRLLLCTTQDYAVSAAERAFEEPLDDVTLEQVSCRDHLSFLRLVPLSHVRQLQLLSST